VNNLNHHLDYALSTEIRETVGHLPKWPGDPTGNAIDYTGAEVAYAVNVILLWGNMAMYQGRPIPTRQTLALLATRSSGEGKIGSVSGISGFVDTLHDPKKLLTDEAFDPVAYTAVTELGQELRIAPNVLSAIDIRLGPLIRNAGINLALGRRFEETRHGGIGTLRLSPMLGLCHDDQPPEVGPDPKEISRVDWVPLGEAIRFPNLSDGFPDKTLPGALAASGLRDEAVIRMIYG
jgi:hypothetical protein